MSSEQMIEEQINPSIVTSLMRNYRNSNEAIFELIDNAVDDKIPGRTLLIEILLQKDTIKITNIGGKGMDIEDIKSFFIWGQSNKRGKLGRYGQGGKAAMGYLGNRWTLTAHKAGTIYTYKIEEFNWKNRLDGRKLYKPVVYNDLHSKTFGYVQFEIRHLSRKINEEKLKKELADVYNYLIETNQIEISLNGIIVGHLNIPLDRKETFSFNIGENKIFSGWLGLLQPDSGLTGGVRCCVLGRKITDQEYFEHKDFRNKASLNSLIGEINADFLEMNLNKTGFDTGDIYWQKVSEVMHKKMAPFIEMLLKKKDDDFVSKDEKIRIKQAGDDFNRFLIFKKEADNVISRLLSTKNDLDEGQKKPEALADDGLNCESEGREERSDKGMEHSPATPPPMDPMGKRKRIGGRAFQDYDTRALPNKYLRSDLITEANNKILIINKNFPLYQKWKGDQMYLYETIIMEYVKPDEEDTVENYLLNFNEVIVEFLKYLDTEKKTLPRS